MESTDAKSRTTVFPGDSELATLMRAKDWSATSLGPVETWPNALRTAVRIVLTSRFSMWMGWGDELVFLYNDAYRAATLGTKHPRALGIPTRELWSEIWDDVAPRIARVLRDGSATWDEDLLLFLERGGYREETYHTFSYSPLHDDDDGRVRGVLCVVTEETARLISERRVALLGQLGAQIAGVNTVEGVAHRAEQALAGDSRDLPFTITYLLDDSGTELRAISRTGFADSDPQPPTVIPVGGHPWAPAEVLTSGQPHEVALDGDRWPSGPWSTPPARLLVVPLAARGQSRAAGVIACGLNPHRAFDQAYRDFLVLFASQLAAGIANARAYEQERERAEALAALDRAKTVFFSNVSHELRTPLTLLLAPLADLVVSPELPPSAVAELETMHRNGTRLLKLVNTMLDFSRIEAGRAVAQVEATDLAELTQDLASVFRAAVERAGLRLRVDCPPIGFLVDVDRDMWEKIVLNLLSNAFKFTLEGEISIALARSADRLDLEVRDTGCGIPPHELPHVFDRFHRVPHTRGRSHEGTGIGLALVQELVRLHGGAVDVTSDVGRGTTVRVSIPARRSSDDHVRPVPAAGERREPNPFVVEALRWLPDEPGDAAPAPAGERVHILIADDNADMRAYVLRLLSPRWDVRAVRNGVEALAAMRERRPALIVTDVMMPELDGFGLLTAMRADPELAATPVIVLSARAGEEARVEGLQAGASDYLVKPFSSRELVARVESQLLRVAVRTAEQAHARRMAALFEQAPVAIVLLRGPQHIFEVANPRYLEIVGHRPLLGRSVAEALPEVVPQGFVDILDQVYRTGESFVGRAVPVQLMRDGRMEEMVFDFVYQPIVDSGGVVTGLAGIGHDVTALAHARGEAVEANRAKDEFLAMLGHELRNPLAPISTALQLMRMRPGVGAERERAVIERQVQHLVGLVDDLLDISRITRGKVELRKEPTAIAEVLSRAIELASPLFEQHHHELVIDADTAVVVDGDPARLAQIFSNLLTNAAKYTPDAGRVEVVVQREGAWAVVHVKDSGIGIEPTMLRTIFEPFAQTRQSLDRSRGGLGLGLAIVDNLARLHGGTVVATSAGPHQGSVFTIRLPALAVASVAPQDRHERALPRGTARVLLVDDNVDAVQMLAEVLRERGYDPALAYDGPSALRTVERFAPQIAVVDIGLPVMDGFELARLLREHPACGATALIALTGYGQPEDRARTAAAGFAAHFVKPVDIRALCDQIEQLLARPAAE